ncbi:MAG TPA: 4Fe-4S binding protein [Chloroflexota bacterium]|nr:4Fe-4S binding protein [Chloroflexota bacterium]
MCEFCTKHGDGKKWYLQAKNYADDLASDLDRIEKTAERLKYFTDGRFRRDYRLMERGYPRMPERLQRVFAARFTRQQKVSHFGQVLPIEDVEKILPMVNSIVRLPCVCRKAVTGKEVAYCIGITTTPESTMGKLLCKSFDAGPDTAGVDRLTPEEALEFMRGLERKGVMHSVWTFETPFIGAICNCERTDCVATRATVDHGLKTMFKGEYIAEVNPDLCVGCGNCAELCQFDAIVMADRKACVDQSKCYGCGSCRAVCAKNAVTLLDRVAVPAVANDW